MCQQYYSGSVVSTILFIFAFVSTILFNHLCIKKYYSTLRKEYCSKIFISKNCVNNIIQVHLCQQYCSSLFLFQQYYSINFVLRNIDQLCVYSTILLNHVFIFVSRNIAQLCAQQYCSKIFVYQVLRNVQVCVNIIN